MTPDGNQDQPAALLALREHLGLHDELPVIEEIHLTNPIACDVSDRTILVCVHDRANERAHQVWFPAPTGPENIVAEGEVRPEVYVHCANYLSAAYN